MDGFLRLLSPVLLGYLLGSVSFAYLLAHSRGISLREIGSGNLGATNAGRALGSHWGVVVYGLDATKGFLPTWFFWKVFGLEAGVLAGCGAYCGHIWPIWFQFRGGKGVATLSGVFLALDPAILLYGGGVLLLVVLLTRYMSVGSVAFGLSLPIFSWIRHEAWNSVFWFALFAGLFLLFTHRSNLVRLSQGREAKLGDSNHE
jgi:glycerol-3-phosphate acyltransferase PlsY